MNLIEKRTAAKTAVIAALVERFPDAVQIDDFEFIIPVTIENEVFYVSMPIGTKDTRGTKASDKRPAREPFVLATAVETWEGEKQERAAIAAEVAAAKAKRNK